jgi:hypothetical protein
MRSELTSTVGRHGRRAGRLLKLLGVAAFVAAVIGGTAGTSLAGSPYTVNMTLRAHKAIEFDPGFLVDAEPCFVTTADITEVLNGEAHILAAGIDNQGNLVPPFHFEKTVEESLVIVPNDPALPMYTGHSTVHQSNFEDSPNAGFTNTITLRGTDGSHLLFHENVHVLVKANGIDLSVDNVHASCS